MPATQADWAAALAAAPADEVLLGGYADWLAEDGQDGVEAGVRHRLLRHRQAQELARALARVDPAAVPVLTRDRCTRLREQARMARALFRTLRVPHLSVRVATGSMCTWVEVGIPRALVAGYGPDAPRCPGRELNDGTEAAIRSILAAAFPAHGDRSDSQTDYYDFCWTFHPRGG